MKRTRRLSALIFLASSASAQSFNVDIGSATHPLPSPTYGAAADQPGAWNPCGPTGTTPLHDLNGLPTAVTLRTWNQIQAAPSLLTEWDAPQTTGDDGALLDDGQQLPAIDWSTTTFWSFEGLEPGRYVLYTYAWSTIQHIRMGILHVPGESVCWGPWPSGHALGVTYTRHEKVLESAGSVVLYAYSLGSPGSVGRIQGMQLVRLPLVSEFCTGDLGDTWCPCGAGSAPNVGGCPNNANSIGGRLLASGLAFTSADTFGLSATFLPNSTGLFIQGTALMNGGIGAVFGDGLRCASGSIVRLATKSIVNGVTQYPEAAEPSISVRGAVTPGLRTYQLWYRDAADFCTPSTFNLTNGVRVVWLP